MPESPRLALWNKSIFLFDLLPIRRWEGPFRRAGYGKAGESPFPYVVGREVLLHDGQNFKTPDLISASGSFWVVLDLTYFPGSKERRLREYSEISPRALRSFGFPPQDGPPILFSVRPDRVDDGPYPQLILGDTLTTANLDCCADSALREEFERVQGHDLRTVPGTSITLLPESKGPEIKEALVPSILELFSPERPVLSALDMVDRGLERLADVVSATSKRTLCRAVEAEMRSLLLGDDALLKDDIEFAEAGYKARGNMSYHPNKLNRVRRALVAWSADQRPGSPQRGLSDFDPDRG